MRELTCRTLTGIDVASDGSGAFIRMATADGAAASLLLPSDCLHQLLMTLPRVIAMALNARYQDPAQRLVFPLTDWKLETMQDGDGLILTLSAQHGFEIAFTVSHDDLAGMLVTADSADIEDVTSRRACIRVN